MMVKLLSDCKRGTEPQGVAVDYCYLFRSTHPLSLRDKIHHYSKHFWYSGGYAVGRREALLKMTVSQKQNDWKRAVY